MTRRRKTQIAGQFCWRLVEMIESEAFRVLSRDAHRVLDRLELEMSHHGGLNNGKLTVTYADFLKYGVERESVAPSIREVVALRFVVVTREGRGGNAEYRLPAQYRLTYRETDNAAPTNEWRTIADHKTALDLARTARRAKSPSAVARSKQASKKQNAASGSPTSSGRDVRPVNEEAPRRNIRPTDPRRDIRPTIYTPGKDKLALQKPSAQSKGQDGDDAIHIKIANRLGSPGWPILMAMPDGDLGQITALEISGGLTDAILNNLRKLYREVAA